MRTTQLRTWTGNRTDRAVVALPWRDDAAMPTETWILVGITVFLVGVGSWRWSVVNRPALTDEECEHFSKLVIEDLFDKAPDHSFFVSHTSSYWRQGGLTDPQWIYLCRWMIGRGLVFAPSNWGWLDIILSSPPSGLALTPKTMGLTMEGRRHPDISIGDGNGPINIGGQQIVISGQTLSGGDLLSLVTALREDALRLPEPDASDVRLAANSLQGAAEGKLEETSPEVVSAVDWVRKRASEAVGNASGSALWAGTVAVAKALGWV